MKNLSHREAQRRLNQRAIADAHEFYFALTGAKYTSLAALLIPCAYSSRGLEKLPPLNRKE